MTNEETTAPDRRRPLWQRALGALRLDANVFDEVEGDPSALPQAAVVVVLAGLARGTAALAGDEAPGLLPSVAGAIVMWLLATSLLAAVGVRWLRGTSDFAELLRTLGFAAMPLWLLAPISLLDGPPQLVAEVLVHGWAIAAAGLAVRQALDVGTGRALVACSVSLAVAAGLLLLLGTRVAFF